MKKASKEVIFVQNKYEDMRANLVSLDSRERYQQKNLKGLIKYAKKLTFELEDYKDKVVMAEKIIQDLKNTGNESLDAILNMMKNYKQKEDAIGEEIEKLKHMIVEKDAEIVSLDQDIVHLRVRTQVV